MDIYAQQKRVTFDELKTNLAKVAWKEAGVPGSSEFDSYSAKLEKERNERLQQQEDATKKMLKHINKGRGKEKKKKDKDKKDKKKEKKGPKTTAEGAVLANSSSSGSEEEDTLLARYKGEKRGG